MHPLKSSRRQPRRLLDAPRIKYRGLARDKTVQFPCLVGGPRGAAEDEVPHLKFRKRDVAAHRGEKVELRVPPRMSRSSSNI